MNSYQKEELSMHSRQTTVCVYTRKSPLYMQYFLNIALSGTTDKTQQTQNRVGSIQLPQYLFQILSSIQKNITGLVFTIYINSSLFPIANTSQDRSIRSPVIGALVAGQNPVEDLTNPVLIDLTLSKNNDVSLRNYEVPHKHSFTFC